MIVALALLMTSLSFEVFELPCDAGAAISDSAYLWGVSGLSLAQQAPEPRWFVDRWEAFQHLLVLLVVVAAALGMLTRRPSHRFSAMCMATAGNLLLFPAAAVRTSTLHFDVCLVPTGWLPAWGLSLALMVGVSVVMHRRLVRSCRSPNVLEVTLEPGDLHPDLGGAYRRERLRRARPRRRPRRLAATSARRAARPGSRKGS